MLRLLSFAALMLAATPALAQQTAVPEAEAPAPPPPTATPRARAGQTAESAAGRVGERQSRGQTEGIEPMARIEGRVANRVQSRIRNRLDRNYDPQANASSPFAVAGQATARAARRGR